MTTTHPNTWEVPTWHPDFGDPEIEIEMLRGFCVKAIQFFPNLTTDLVTPEEGYLNVDVFDDSKKIAELHVVVDDEKRRFGLFGFDGEEETEELYFLEHDQGLKELSKLLK